MIGRFVLAALLAGLAAGLVLAVIQHVRLTPMIVEAETYETAAVPKPPQAQGETRPDARAHDHGQTAEHEHGGWQPADGAERSLITSLSSLLAGSGFAAMLAGISLLSGLPITARNGLMWGVCGFLAVTLAPAAGLPPELPGMPAADLAARQVWWLATIAVTGAGIYILSTRRELTWAIAAVILIAAPHIVGAPQVHDHASAVPAGLASAFASNALAAAAVFWCVLGLTLGIAMDRFGLKEQTR